MSKPKPHKKLKAEKQKWEENEEDSKHPTDDYGSADLKKWKKDLKQSRITKEEYDKLRGIEEQKAVPTQEEKVAELRKIALCDWKPHTKSKDVKIECMTVSYKGQPLLVETDFIINSGRKYGLIGPNGCGKSTLLKHISMRHISVPEHINILHVEEEIEGTEETALDAVLRADKEREALLAEEQVLLQKATEDTDAGCYASERLPEIVARMKQIGGYTAKSRATAILTGLQFSQEMQQTKTKDFSGGWRMRISLARALFLQPTLLILDEPTNHLDLDASIWLETYLKNYTKTLLLVSHDREFLTNIVTDIIEVHDKKLNYYEGNYESYERLRDEKGCMGKGTKTENESSKGD